MLVRVVLAGITAGIIVGSNIVLPPAANAQQNAMKLCGAEWQQIKSKNKGEAPKGVTWRSFLSECRKRLADTGTKATAKKATAQKKAKAETATKAKTAAAAASPQNAMKLCGAEWQQIKSKNKGEAPKGVTWRSFLSECRERLADTGTNAKTVTAAVSPQNAMKLCGAEWQQIKSKNKGEAPKGMTWRSFLSECRGRQSQEATAKKVATPKPRKAAVKSKASGESMMAACGGEWRQLKETNKVPKGMTWTVFLSACSERYAGKFKPTSAQLAMYGRIRECGAQWRDDKAKGRLREGSSWPKFWSECNTRLKQNGR
ncbi:MAG: hypothetical protein ACR2PG_01745 [Hyphomicrobiaceae bacterium]